MKRIAVIGAILENPHEVQQEFNQIVSDFQGMIKGRMGIPMPEENLSMISLTVVANVDEINALTGNLGNIKGVKVKTAISDRSVNG